MMSSLTMGNIDPNISWRLVASQLIKLGWSYWCLNGSKGVGIGWILLRALDHLQKPKDKLRSLKS